MEAHSRSVQLIDEDGKFNSETLKSFTKTIQLNQCNSSYAVVSIMGPQSSGKSTLLNHLFGTKFQEMDASEGRSQTTKGIWMAKAVDIDPLTLIVDVEGNDGVERGEDDTKFEAQSALFVLAISDVVIINMWCHDVGREKAANRALLKITFQEMMRILTPRKATLMFVLRDKTKSPLDTLKAKLIRDVEKIWGSIWKPPAHVKTQLHEIFNIEVVALSNYEDKPENFKEEVDCLKRKFFRSTTPGGLAGDRSGAVPGSGFSINAEKLWQLIRQDQNLDLPSLKIMVSTHRCKQIAAKEFSSFDESKEWLQIRENIRTGLLSGSGKVLDALFDKTFERYLSEAICFDKNVASEQLNLLEDKLISQVEKYATFAMSHLRYGILEKFKKAFDKALSGGELLSLAAVHCTSLCMTQFEEGFEDAIGKRVKSKWDTSTVKEELQLDIDAYIDMIRKDKLHELEKAYEGDLCQVLSEPLRVLLDQAECGTWPAIRKIFRHETGLAIDGFSNALTAYGVDKQMQENMIRALQEYAIGLIAVYAEERAKTVLTDMIKRFERIMEYDCNFNPRVWTPEDDFHMISQYAFSASLELLSVVAAIRLDDENDNIYDTLIHALLTTDSGEGQNTTSLDSLNSRTWLEIPSEKTLIMPVECERLWKKFMDAIHKIIKRGKKKWKIAKTKEVVKNVAEGFVAGVAVAAGAAGAAVAAGAAGPAVAAGAVVAAVALG